MQKNTGVGTSSVFKDSDGWWGIGVGKAAEKGGCCWLEDMSYKEWGSLRPSRRDLYFVVGT